MTTTEEGESQIGEEEYRIGKKKGTLVFSFIFVQHKELFCQAGYQNSSSSTGRAIHGAKAKKKKLHW
jgi:hypothetical protein